MPYEDIAAETVTMHLVEISTTVALGTRAILVLNGSAGTPQPRSR